ncbi:kinesin family protein-like protein [Dothidotthia symphoricarpi CBS 119687]|uniref:Kinesin family protein-like protein n=1 Tax=Dothidotthia symphoricarpi CBS 119687 TaxID=1392245 RepID=A0A6A6APM8_9PLEO|nr:kinesin family protein-like protein [Dothidotthia symphoricarpi CBS 119687]KAF2132894.1 kinesin family protein-like protein [Dothidotthia symphoricarpi CBS 119687]
MMSAGGGNIKVVVRCRPFNGREKDRNAQCIVRMKGDQTILSSPSDPKGGKAGKAAAEGPKTFAFDRSYWSFDRNAPNYAGQDNLHEDLGKPLLDNAFQGYNNCIFAYGQTGSGKSYSMMGYGQEYGIIPKICQDMFERIKMVQQDKHESCTVEVSYLEIYNERVRDLLNPSNKGNLRVREHPSTGPYVEDLAKLVVQSFAEIENLMDEGNKARTVAATNMNETSSRSHAVFTLTLTQKRHDEQTSMSGERVAKISLVDLAGSERAQSTGATGARLKEGAEINRSLSTLGRVIAALADIGQGKKKTQVPYRDSILTWLLKDSLGGNSMTAMIAAISPADINFEETLSTLRYADSAKRIKNHAVVNEDPNARMIRELKEELSKLRSQLSGGASGGGGGGGIVAEQYAPDTPLEKQIVSITQSDGTIKKVSKAEIVEQLDQSEKLYNDLNQTWEEKLAKTEEIHKEREAALEELGISIEKGNVGLSTPKNMPHLINLSDDPLLDECLVYNLKPGTTTVGNSDAEGQVAQIKLNGSQVLADHCTFENVDGTITVSMAENASVIINGIRIVDSPTQVNSGDRVILGNFHIFRLNNPQQARAVRAEVGASLLRHSIAANHLNSPSPAPRPGHDRSFSAISLATSDFGSGSPRAGSPAPWQRGRESEFTFARREALTAWLGPEKRIENLPDDEFDAIFEDLRRLKETRKVRPESRIYEQDEDMESISSFPLREKYTSGGTFDNFSLDTALTMPSTPQQDDSEKGRELRMDSAEKLVQHGEDLPARLKAVQETKVKVELEELRAAKEDMQKQLQGYERQLRQLGHEPTPATNGEHPTDKPNEQQLDLVRNFFHQWRQRKYVTMAETILQNAATLKEAQIMSHQMDKSVVFQFCIVGVGHTVPSSYDLVNMGIPGEDDEFLDNTPKPCVGVRVIDFRNKVVHLWSLQKLRQRVRRMHQMHQYMNRPGYIQHFKPETPFSEPCMPEFSRIGDVDVPLAAVFNSRVRDFSLDVISPYTANPIGIIRLSLEPSSAEAPSTTLKFNVGMHEMVGFPEREGTKVHALLFVPGISDESGATTTIWITDFNEGPIRFESIHSMSLPYPSPRDTFLRISIFAQVNESYLDMLLSWDDMRDPSEKPKKKRRNARLPESEFYTEDTHDIFSRIQVHEPTDEGTYQPVDVTQSSVMDAGVYQLHLGVARRIVVNLTHTCGDTLQWQNVTSMRMGRIRLIDSVGNAPGIETPVKEVPIALISAPTVKNNADGTTNVKFVGRWDSTAHNSLLLDRPTQDKYRVQATLLFNVMSAKLVDPMVFSLDLALQIRGRIASRPTSLFSLASLWGNTVKTVHSTVGIFNVAIRPTSVKRATDLWRMNTRDDYIKGEEQVSGWTPRGVSLVRDFINIEKRRRRIAEIETARSVLSSKALSIPPSTSRSSTPQPDLDDRQKALLQRVISLWQTHKAPAEIILNPTNLEPPKNGAAFAPRSASPSPSPTPSLTATVRFVSKNPNLLKSSYLLMPDPTNSRWIRRFVELRKPYLHVYSTDGDEINAINLTNARIDHSPQIARLLGGTGASLNGSAHAHVRRGSVDSNGSAASSVGGTGKDTVWAVFARTNTYILRARSEREKIEWILRLDQSYFSSEGSESTED